MGEFDFNALSQGCSLAAPGLILLFPIETPAKMFVDCYHLPGYCSCCYFLVYLSLWLGGG